MTIYLVSDKKQFGGKLDGETNMNYLNDEPLYEGEHYLYKQEWYQTWDDQLTLNHEIFVKVVNDEWLAKHNNYYNCPVYETVKNNTYDKFLNDFYLD